MVIFVYYKWLVKIIIILLSLLQMKLQLLFFQLTTSQKFDIFIMIVILLNMMTMAIEHYDQPDEFDKALHWINQIFVLIFSCECVMKLLGLRHYYFKQPWNIFDFVVVISSVLSEFSFGAPEISTINYTRIVLF